MDNLSLADFGSFFKSVYKSTPFPWQQMMLEKVAIGKWPDLVDLPTASGKTACIDIAVFALALQADLAPEIRTARRRIFFVVDRRIVVDEAFERANMLAEKLARAESGILKIIADRLRDFSGGLMPLAVAKLRGGIANIKQAWSQDPLQPAIITATVDQVGSRLLFRSYGGGSLVAPIHAALVAYDSLIILDEAHCSRPFMQTVGSVQNYLSVEKWSDGKVSIAPPLQLMVMSATARREAGNGETMDVFPASADRIAALADEILRKRANAVKSARLELITKGGKSALAEPVCKLTIQQARKGCKRIAIMVNRVKLAHDIAMALAAANKSNEGSYDIVLLTGQMRPIDRDDLSVKWSPKLRASTPEEHEKPIMVVTTQCLEVGADFSFDSLITQCSSIDSLLQRFGRLDRMGVAGKSEAFILVSKDDIRSDVNDPIYGTAIASTWKWLSDRAKDSPEPGTVNFAISAMGELVRDLAPDELIKLLAPHADAPTLMPAHVDILCQTAPHPEPDIDVPAYLHGVGHGEPQVRVAFRVDITDEKGQFVTNVQSSIAYSQLFTWCPLNKQECLNVPLFRLKKYLQGQVVSSDVAGDEDVEGAVRAEESKSESRGSSVKQFLCRRNGNWEQINSSESHHLIRPNDLIVLPMHPGDKIPENLGTNLDGVPIDRAEEAAWIGRSRDSVRDSGGLFLRISKSVLDQSPLKAASQPLLDWLLVNCDNENPDGPDSESLKMALEAVASTPVKPEEITLQRFVKICKSIKNSLDRSARFLKPHPVENESWIVSIPRDAMEIDDSLTDEDTASNSRQVVLLADHLNDVRMAVGKFVHCMPVELQKVLEMAGKWHDLGKLDHRFQDILGNNIGDMPRAKSEFQSGRKSDFRHEMISLQIVQNCLIDQLPTGKIPRELLLHLISAHHGHARPFAPVRDDAEPVDIIAPDGFEPVIKLTAEARNNSPKPHQLGSGIPDRFWYLTRHFGWWGLAYIESMLRFADWAASANPTIRDIESAEAVQQ